MTRAQLDTPFLDGGIRSTNFFNGRLLSREDMQREQDAARAAHERLGRALGAGIAQGLEVEAVAIGGSSVADPVVTVRAGLAVNRRGQTIALDRDVAVSLLRPAAPATGGSVAAGGFATCAPPENAVYVVGTGAYLLTVAPASQTQGLAVVSGLNNTASPCNAKERVEGVQFHLYQVKLAPTELADDAHLRNAVAYKFFAAGGATTDAVRDPFGVAAAPAALTDPAVPDCDVPLAVFQWTAAGGLRWVDLWSVRRGLSGALDPPLGGTAHRARVGEARLRQFLDEIGQISATSRPALKASDRFAFLPPVGALPLPASGGSPIGAFDLSTFFSGLTTRDPVVIDAARVAPLLDASLLYPPIELASHELIWLYYVRQNMASIAAGAADTPYVVFATGHTPYQGNARLDLAHLDFANHSLRIRP